MLVGLEWRRGGAEPGKGEMHRAIIDSARARFMLHKPVFSTSTMIGVSVSAMRLWGGFWGKFRASNFMGGRVGS